MPVATQASLKGLTPKQLEETGCRLCLNNTYHLYVNNYLFADRMLDGRAMQYTYQPTSDAEQLTLSTGKGD
jgi:tRNA-guanine family transglycosylase